MKECIQGRCRRFGRSALLVVGLFMAAPPLLVASGFGPAAKTAVERSVKLYGLGAGVQVNYGTGTLVSSDGKVLTVLSLLIDAHRVRAVSADGVTYEAKTLARDVERQLALLKLVPWTSDRETAPEYADDGGYSSSSAELAHPSVGPFPFFDVASGAAKEGGTNGADDDATPGGGVELQPGDWVVAAGNAFKVAVGAEPVSITHGIFSTRTRLDARRRVKAYPYRGDVLIIDAITSNPGAPGGAVVDLEGNLVGLIGRVVQSTRTHTRVNHAVPRDVLIDFLRESEERSAGGELVLEATPQPGDDEDDVTLITDKPRSEPVDVGIRLSRTGYRQVLPFVERVRHGSTAGKAGVRVDDLILSINGRSVSDVKEYDTQVSHLRPGEAIDLVVRRGRRIVSIHIETESAQ